MRSSSSNTTTIKDLPDVSSMPSMPKFGVEVSVENHSRRREPPRDQDDYDSH
jgi:hypothetical protein